MSKTRQDVLHAREPEFADPRLPARFWAKVRLDESGCWAWIASVNSNGYAQISWQGSPKGAHRVAYEALVGVVPSGLQLDHLCRIRSCVNPAHLEPVTGVENWRRGMSASALNARKTHCHIGHPLSGANLIVYRNGDRSCRACALERCHRYRDRLRLSRSRQGGSE